MWLEEGASWKPGSERSVKCEKKSVPDDSVYIQTITSRHWKLNYRSAKKKKNKNKHKKHPSGKMLSVMSLCPLSFFIQGVQFASFKSMFYNSLLHSKTWILMIQTILKEKLKVIIKQN